MDKVWEFFGNKSVQKVMLGSALLGGTYNVWDKFSENKTKGVIFAPMTFVKGAVDGAIYGFVGAGLYNLLWGFNTETLPALDDVVDKGEKVLKVGKDVVTEGVIKTTNSLKTSMDKLSKKK